MVALALPFIVLYFSLLGTLVFVGYFLQQKRELSYGREGSDGINLTELTVLVPFRNEADRIEPFLASVLACEYRPFQFIFVDDHSTDDTAAIIARKLSGVKYRLIQLEEGAYGKKEAIRRGIAEIETSFILGMDADVVFEHDFFKNIEKLAQADLYVLPAVHRAKTLWQYLFEIDILLVNAVNAGISGWKRPILASGANLLYKKEAFLELDRYEKHKHMPSGDDIYLLRDFRNGQAAIRLITSVDLAVYTGTPKSFSEFIHQRLRWIAKTGDVKDHLSTTLAVLQVFLTAGYTIVLFSFLYNVQIDKFLLFYCSKVAIDVLLFLPFVARTNRLLSLIFFPLYEFLFPLYSLLVLFLMYTFKPVWKGRKLTRNF